MNNQPPDRSDLNQARGKLDSTRQARAQLLVQVSDGAAKLEELLRTLPAGDPRVKQAQAAQAALESELKKARGDERTARECFVKALTAYLPEDPAQEIERLDADTPIILLPVRIETRFDTGNQQLMMRIYLDECFADSFEPELTEQEMKAGQSYWAKTRNNAEQEQAEWSKLVTTFSTPRAAWIVKATEPPVGTPGGTAGVAEPQPEPRPSNWNRAVEARLQPDRWLAVAYRNGDVAGRAVSRPVAEPLALTHDPQSDEDENARVLGDEVPVDDGIAWMVDFDRALADGMAVTMPLTPDDLLHGFDQLFVVGVKSSLTPLESSARLGRLLDAHHYTRGLAFVEQGTPTNNTSDGPSGFPPDDPNGENSFKIERRGFLPAEGSNGHAFTSALGIDPRLAESLAGAERTEQPNASAMNNALWPVTMGYFLEQIMAPVFDAGTISEVRRHFTQHVIGRGPLPAFRIGGTPYGILPVSSLTFWQPRGHGRGIDGTLPPLLGTLRGIWASQIPNVPRIGQTSDPDKDLLAVLGMEASTQRIRARTAYGWHFTWNLFELFGIDWTAWFNNQQIITNLVANTLGDPTLNPRALWMTFDEASKRLGRPFVSAVLSEKDKLAENYIEWIRLVGGTQQLKDETYLQGKPRPAALFYYLLRHAALTEYSREAFRLLLESDYVTESDRVEPELVGIVAGTQQRLTAWDRFGQRIPVTQGKTLGEYLLVEDSPSEPVNSYRGSLMRLENLPTAELDRLFTETLDICSHRLDAWITSLADKRLQEMRQRQPMGIHLAAYGWVEELHPNPRNQNREVELADGRTAFVQPSSGGYIHAPSMSHAAAAAILRSGYLTRSGEQRARYAIDLSSERVRLALYLIDSVRQGQSLGAVLGYRFERGVHEGHRPLELDKYTEPLRELFPLTADKGGSPSGEPAETIAARDVVDGLALRNAWREHRDVLRDIGLPPISHTVPVTPKEHERLAMEEELRRLDDTVDTLADLLTAESVYQIVQGNMTAAAASLDSLAGGLGPPDPQIARAPRSGTTFTHRVAVVLGGDGLAAPDWPDLPASPRAKAEPYLNGWAGLLLGNPAQVKCKVNYKVGLVSKEGPVTLADLNVQPLDLLGLTVAVNQQAQDSELDRRVIYHLATMEGTAVTEVSISYARVEAADRTFPEILELAQAINKVIGGARPLRLEDLAHPAEGVDEEKAAMNHHRLIDEELIPRVQAAIEDLDGAIGSLNGAVSTDDVGEALVAAARFGVAGAIPVNRHDDSVPFRDQLLEQRRSVLAELDQRATAAKKAKSEAGAATGEIEKIAKLIEAVQAVFGREFVLLPRFKPADPVKLERGFDVIVSPDPMEPPGNILRKWMQQVARVRPGLGRWRKLLLYAGALIGYDAAPSGTNTRYRVAQLPHAPDERWVGLPFPLENQRPQSGRLSLVLHSPDDSPVGEKWAGLLLDEWSEVIPHRNETTAIAFNYDDPGVEAPQTILLATPPIAAGHWDLTAVLAILRETLELAKLRAVDGHLLGSLGQLLPALYLSSNAADEAISTDLSPFWLAEPNIEFINIAGPI